jgi:hypothetical protein
VRTIYFTITVNDLANSRAQTIRMCSVFIAKGLLR